MNAFADNMQNQLRWLRRAQHALWVAMLVLGAAVYLLWIKPENAKLDSYRQLITNAEHERLQHEELAESTALIDANIAVLKQRAARFDKELPSQLNLAQFINDVTRISREASLENLSWHVDSGLQVVGRVRELPILLTFSGDFKSGVMRFLLSTEQMQRLTRVRKLNLKPDPSHQGQVTAELMMNIYCGDQW
jgi:Tfp pilus assembly protein PilO